MHSFDSSLLFLIHTIIVVYIIDFMTWIQEVLK